MFLSDGVNMLLIFIKLRSHIGQNYLNHFFIVYIINTSKGFIEEGGELDDGCFLYTRYFAKYG